MRGFRNWIMLGAGCAAALLVAFGGASAESVEGSIQGNTGKQASSDSSQQDYYWKVWNGALPEQRDKDDHNDVLAVLTGKFTGPPIGCKFGFRGGGLAPSTIAADEHPQAAGALRLTTSECSSQSRQQIKICRRSCR